MNFVYSSLPVVVNDYFSKYVEVSLRRSLTSPETIRSLKFTLARHAVPDVVCSENGPQYCSDEFIMFARDWDFSSYNKQPYLSTVKRRGRESSADRQEPAEEVS